MLDPKNCPYAFDNSQPKVDPKFSKNCPNNPLWPTQEWMVCSCPYTLPTNEDRLPVWYVHSWVRDQSTIAFYRWLLTFSKKTMTLGNIC